MKKNKINIPAALKKIALVIIDKSSIIQINSKAKKTLSLNTNNQKQIHTLLCNAVKKNKKEIIIDKQKKVLKINVEKVKNRNKNNYIIIFEDITEQKKSTEKLNLQIELFEDMFEHLPIGILMHDHGKLKYVNKEAKRIIGTYDKKKYFNQDLLNLLYDKKERKKAIERMHKLYTEKKLPPTIYHIKNFKDQEKIIELSALLFYTKKQPLAILIVQDKTNEINQQQLEIQYQLKHHENKLLIKQNAVKEKILSELEIKKEQLLNTIHHADYLFWITDEKLNIILYNNTFYNYCLKYYNIKPSIGMSVIDKANQINNSTKKETQESLIKILKEKKDFEYEVKQFDKQANKQRVYKILLRPTLGKNKSIKNIYCYGHEITEKYDFLNQIENHSVKLNTIIHNSPIYLWSINKNMELTLFNTNYQKLIQTIYGEIPTIGKKLSKGKYSQNQNFIETLNYHYQKAFNGSKENFQLNFNIENEKQITLDINLFPIIILNEIYEVSGIATDITTEIEKQKQLENLLKENEILIKEVHHRIKNNLQVISSMLNLQIQNEDSTTIKNVLKDTQNRIFSMANIHQTLYQNRNYSSINIANNILSLIQNTLYSFNKTEIQIQSDIEDIILDVNTAIPLSLIINETITNIVKYAFPPNYQTNSKTIYIQLSRQNYHIHLTIKDNGIGIPKNQITRLSSVGFTIIRALSEQINAKISIHSQLNKGTEIKLAIPQL